MALLQHAGEVAVANTGRERAYLATPSGLKLLTVDHRLEHPMLSDMPASRLGNYGPALWHTKPVSAPSGVRIVLVTALYAPELIDPFEARFSAHLPDAEELGTWFEERAAASPDDDLKYTRFYVHSRVTAAVVTL